MWFPNESTKRVKTMKSVTDVNDRFDNSNQIKISKSGKKVGLNETGVLSGIVEPASVKSLTRSSNSLNDSRLKIQSTSHEADQSEEVISLYSSISSELSAAERDIESIKILSGRSAETSASFFQQNNRLSSSSDVKVSRNANSTQEFHTAENEDNEVFDTARTVLSPHENTHRRVKDSLVKTSKNMSKISSKEVLPSKNPKGIGKEISNDVVKSSISTSLNEVEELKQRKKNEQLNMPIQSSLLVKNKVNDFEEKTQDIISSAIIVLSDDEGEEVSDKRIVEPKISKNNQQQFVEEKAQKTDDENQASIAVDRNQNKHNLKMNKSFEPFSQVAKSSTSIRNKQDTKNKADSKYSFNKKKDNQEGGTVNKRFVSSTNTIIEDSSEKTKTKEKDQSNSKLLAKVIKSSDSTTNPGEKIEEQLTIPVSSSLQINNKFAESEDLTPNFLTSPNIAFSDDESEKANCKRIVKPKLSKNIEQRFVEEEAQNTDDENQASIAVDRNQNKHNLKINKSFEPFSQMAKRSTSIRHEQDTKNKADSKYSFIKKKDNQESGTVNKRFVSSTNKIIEDTSEKTTTKERDPINSKLLAKVIKSSDSTINLGEKIEEQLTIPVSSSLQIKNKFAESEDLTPDFLTSPNIVFSDDESENANCKRIVKPKLSKNIEQRFVEEEAHEAHKESSSEIKTSVNKNNYSQEVGIGKESFASSINKIIKNTFGDSKIDELHQKKDKQEVEEISRKNEIHDETKAGQPNNKISFSDEPKRSQSKKELIRERSLEDSEKENQKESLKGSISRRSVKELENEKFVIKKKKNLKRLINERKRIIPREDSTDDEIGKEECHKILNISTLGNRKQIEVNFQEYSSRESDLNDTNRDNNNTNKTKEFPESECVKSSKTVGKQIENREIQSSKINDEMDRHEISKIVILSDIRLKPNERLGSKRVHESKSSTEKSHSPNSQPHFVESKNTIQQLGEKEVEKQAAQVEDNHNKLLKLLDGDETSDEEIFSTWNTFSRLQGKRLTKISEISDEGRFEAESKKSIQPPKAEMTFKELTIPLQKCNLLKLKNFYHLTEKETKETKEVQESIITFNEITVPITEEVIVSPDIFEDGNNDNLNAKESQKSETVSQIEKEIQIFVKNSKQDKLIQDKIEINNQEHDADSDNYTFDGDFPPNPETGPKPIIDPETAFDELMKEDVLKKTLNNKEHEKQIIVTKETMLNQHQPERTKKVPAKEMKEVTCVDNLAKKNDKKLRTKFHISQKNKDQTIVRDEIEELTDQAFDAKQKNYEHKKVTPKEIKEVSYGEDVAKKTDKKPKTKSQISQESEEQIIARDEIEEVTSSQIVVQARAKSQISQESEEEIIARDEIEEVTSSRIVVQALVHETSKQSKKVVTFDQTTANEEQIAENDGLDLRKKPSELNQSLITTISNRSGRRKRLLYDPNLPVDQFISNNTSIQNKSFTTASKHNKTLSSSIKFDEISVAEPTHQNVKKTDSIFVEQTDQNDKEVESILSTQQQNEDEAIPSEIVNVDDSIEMRRPARRNAKKNKNNSKPERLTETIRKMKINKNNNIVSSRSRFDNNQNKRSDLKSAFEDMLESFRSELGGRTLLEEMEIKKLQMSTSLFESRKKKKNYKRKKSYRVTKRNCLVSLGTPTLSKRKDYDSESSDKSVRGDSKKDKAKSLRKSNRTSNKNMNECVENDFRKLKAANRRKRLLESTRFDEVDFNDNNVDEDSLDLSPNKKRRLPDDVEELGSFRVTVSDSAPAWHGIAVKGDKFVTIKSEEFLGRYLILFFYPLDFGFHPHVQGPKEILIFNEKIDEFKALNCEIVVCSVDSHYTHLYWIKSSKEKKSFKEMKIILLSDANHDISKAFGVYVPRWGHTLRSWFIINPTGIIRMQTVVDAPLEVDVGNILEQLDRLRKIEENL